MKRSQAPGLSAASFVKDVLMRIHHRLTAFTGCLASLVVGTSLFAQSAWGPPGVPGQYTGHPPQTTGQLPMVPPQFQPTFSSNNASALYPPAAPPHAYPFPDVSPHLGANVLQEQHYNRDGNWFNEVIQRGREWYFTAEAMQMHFDGPGDARIGSRIVDIRNDSNSFNAFPNVPGNVASPADNTAIAGTDSSEVIVGPGAFPWPFQQSALPGFPGTAVIVPPEIFPIRGVNELFEDNPSSPGFKVRAGYFNNDGTGIGLEGWYALQNNEFWEIGQSHFNGIPVTQNLIITNAFSFLVSKVGAVPLEENSGAIDVIFPGAGFTGTTAKYDVYYRTDIASEAGGGDVKFYLGNLMKTKRMRATAFATARYMYLDEYFRFRGIDSGFTYMVDTMMGTFRPMGTIIQYAPEVVDARLQSFTTSHLAGPEVGLRVDLGRSKRFNLWMQLSAGLMVNHERLQVRGENIGNGHFFSTFDPGPPLPSFGNLSPALDMFNNDTRFNDIERHTTVSPTFNFGINTDLDVFPYVPVLKYIPICKEAHLNLGYNFMLIGSVSRPADAIRWRGFPQFPSVRVDRQDFTAHQLSAGVTFRR